MKPIEIEDNDENADWLKYLDGGKYQKEDLAAHEEIEKHHKGEEPPPESA